ncbi:MAG: HPr family phosphocarrier protein [Phycisphaerae bacterium]|jgi:phosphocarrier protein
MWGQNACKTQAEEDTLGKVVCETEVEIKNAEGLHMRPAMKFVDTANRFECDITVSNNENKVDGKSIMQMSMLAATCGTRLKIKAEGEDAQQAIDALRELVEVKHFDEPAPDESEKH